MEGLSGTQKVTMVDSLVVVESVVVVVDAQR